MKGERASGSGRAVVRPGLFMATLVACRCNPPIKAHCAALRAKGKPANRALVACMRKLLVILYAMLRDRKP